MPTRISDETRDLILAALRAGRKVADIAREAGVGTATVTRAGIAAGLARGAGRPVGAAEDVRGEARILAREGLSVAEIAVQVERSERSVRGYLSRLTATERPSQRPIKGGAQ